MSKTSDKMRAAAVKAIATKNTTIDTIKATQAKRTATYVRLTKKANARIVLAIEAREAAELKLRKLDGNLTEKEEATFELNKLKASIKRLEKNLSDRLSSLPTAEEAVKAAS